MVFSHKLFGLGSWDSNAFQEYGTVNYGSQKLSLCPPSPNHSTRIFMMIKHSEAHRSSLWNDVKCSRLVRNLTWSKLVSSEFKNWINIWKYELGVSWMAQIEYRFSCVQSFRITSVKCNLYWRQATRLELIAQMQTVSYENLWLKRNHEASNQFFCCAPSFWQVHSSYN